MLSSKNLLRLVALGLACLMQTSFAVASETDDGEAAASSPQAIITASCSGCHMSNGEDRWFRISEQRKTPEGWQMTLARMQFAHQAQFIDPALPDDDGEAAFRTLVKYLSDNQGLAPAESADYRYILERELNTIEQHESEQFRTMCARCHTKARTALQRRTEDEWRNLVHFHLGQYPTTEYQMMGRDRDWIGTALNDVVPSLAQDYPAQTDDWAQWQAASKPELGARWRVVGYMPGTGEFSGEMVSEATGDDRYTVELSGSFANGEPMNAAGSAIVYTGYEWRGLLRVGDVRYKQVLAASADGTQMSGRMFERDHDERGLRLQLFREDGQSRVLAVQPSYLRSGSEGQLEIIGTNLAGEVNLGAGVKILETLSQDAKGVTLRVMAEQGAEVGARAVKVGDSSLADGLTVFERIDRIEVQPAYAIGRVGGDGGSQGVVQAIFDAIAWSAGADGETGSDDDIRIGPVAASWSVQPFNEQAVIDEDLKFAGQMDKDSGIFTPGAAGPNPERKYQTNNAGNLKVIATVAEGEESVQGDGQLIVTVQRWNNPPIR